MSSPLAPVRRTFVVLVTALASMAAATLAAADGIDISHWQGTVAWSKVDAAGTQFAFMKATEGSTYSDPTLSRNWAGAKAVGIYRGAYHFARPSVGSAAAQARHYVSKVPSFTEAGSLPPVLDLEATGGLSRSALRTWVSTWLSTVENLTGRVPILYFSPSFWESNLGNDRGFSRYPLWIAHYTTGAPRIPGGWSGYTFWQYTSTGRVSGIAGNVDKNRFGGTSAQLAALARTTGGTTAPVPAGPTLPTAASATVTMTAPAATAAINDAMTFSGDVTGTVDRLPVAGRAVGLWSRSAGATAWTRVANGTTDPSGHFALSARVPRSSDFSVRSVGDAAYAAAGSPIVRVTTPARVLTQIDQRASRVRVRRGGAVRLSGLLTSPQGGLAGQRVRVYKKPLRGGSWALVRTTTSLAPAGGWSVSLRPRRSRIYQAVSADTLWYVGARSNRVTVRVR